MSERHPKLGKCSYGDCHKDARYVIGWLSDRSSWHFGPVCGEHDRVLGRRNLSELLRIPMVEAIRLDLQMDRDIRRIEDAPETIPQRGKDLD